MAQEPTNPDDASLDHAIARAKDELAAMMEAASVADETSDKPADDCIIHEVEGIGRYAIPTQGGWVALLGIIHDITVGIDFSVVDYPSFDAILAERSDAPNLFDASEAHYADTEYRQLRENIAAVRNFLLETYYSHTPAGMTPRKAKDALEQIAAYLGDGLYQYLQRGGIPGDDPNQPFVDRALASAAGGEGAQYLYQKILDMNHQSDWFRPFAAVAALFGGKPPSDWMLPPMAALAFVEKRDTLDLEQMVHDLDAISEHLLYTAEQMQNSGVAHLSESVRHESVEIAKEILRKLKLAFGETSVIDGLRLKPSEDTAVLGAIRGVVIVYDRLLAWGRGIDPSIMQHPTIISATQAVGQLGYLIKMEAHRAARASGNTGLAQRISNQLKRVPAHYAASTDKQFSKLLDRIERGIDTVMNRVQEISGPNALVGFTPGKEIGNYMSGTPLVGQASQAGADGATNRSGTGKQAASILQAQEAAERAQAARVQSQINQRNQQTGQRQQTSTAPARTPGGRQAQRQAQDAQRRAASSSSNANPAQISQQAARTAAQRAAAWKAHDDQQHAHDHPPAAPAAANPATINPNLVNPALINKIRAATNTANLPPVPANSNPMLNTRSTPYVSQPIIKPPVTPNLKAAPPKTAPAKPGMSEEEKRKQTQQVQPPPHPHKPSGRGH